MISYILIAQSIGYALVLLLCFVRVDCRAADDISQTRIFMDIPAETSLGASANAFSSASPDAHIQRVLRFSTDGPLPVGISEVVVPFGNSAPHMHAGFEPRRGIENVSSAEVPSKEYSSLAPGRAATSEPQQGQDLLPSKKQEFQNTQNSAPRERYNTFVGGDSTEILSGGTDAPWKRKARLQGIRMRMLYGPESLYHGSFINSTSERGSRHVVGAVVPLRERWEITVLNHLSLFSLKEGNSSAGRESMLVRVGMGQGKSFRPWLALTPYTNFGDAHGDRASISTGMSKSWKDGTTLATEVYAWRPWDEGYYTLVEDGQRHGGSLALTLPVSKKLLLSTRAHYELLELGSKAKSGAQYAGSRYGWNARAYYRLMQREGTYMGHGFRNDDLWNEYLVGSELGAFVNLDWQRYQSPESFDALYPVPKAFGQQLGFSYQHAFSPHLGLNAESYIGRDPDRNLQFGELLGVNIRLTMLLNPHFRIWCALGYVKMNTTLESEGGSENTVSFGINYNF